MLNACIPVFEAAYTQKITAFFLAAVNGKRFCGPLTSFQGNGPGLAADPLPANDGGNIQCAGPPAAGGAVGGVMMGDVGINGRQGVIRGKGTILPCSSGAAVNSGQEVQVDAQGRVVPFAAGTKVGLAHSTVAGADLDVIIELY